MKKILLIQGHPKKESFCGALFDAYQAGVMESDAEVRVIQLKDLPLEQYLRYDFSPGNQVGQEIIQVRNDITWADHLVFFHPVWWGGTPAILKCFIDIVFASGFAFQYRSESQFPEQLLKGKTAHIFTTLDSPPFLYRYVWGAPSVNQLKKRTLEFCGIRPVKVTYVGPIRHSTNTMRDSYLAGARVYGKAEGRL